MASVWLKRGVRVLIVLLSATALLVWHPEWVTAHPSAPALVEVERHAVAKGVTLCTGRVQGTSWRVIDLAVDLASARLQVGAKQGGGTLEDLLPLGSLAAVNGAFFERDFSPHGWVVDGSEELQPLREASPHHVFAVRGAEVFIGQREALPFAPELALQNFPLLVVDGKVRVAERQERGYPRTFVCDGGEGVVHLVVLLPRFFGPSLFDTARIAAWPTSRGGLGCRAALNLDGGPSSGYWVGGAFPVSEAPGTPVGQVLAVLPR